MWKWFCNDKLIGWKVKQKVPDMLLVPHDKEVRLNIRRRKQEIGSSCILLQSTMQLKRTIRSWWVDTIFNCNCLASAHFWLISDKSFSDWCKTVNIFQGKYLWWKRWNFLTKKNLKGWTAKPEMFHEDKTDQS